MVQMMVAVISGPWRARGSLVRVSRRSQARSPARASNGAMRERSLGDATSGVGRRVRRRGVQGHEADLDAAEPCGAVFGLEELGVRVETALQVAADCVRVLVYVG